MLGGGLAVAGDHDALARGQAVRLDHVGRAEGVERVADLGPRAAGAGGGGRDAGGEHDLLGGRLRALDHGGGPVGAEAAQPRLAQGVAHAGHQRRLRADHDQVGGGLPGQRGDVGRVGERDLVQLGELADPGVTRRGVQAGHVGVAG